MVEVLRRTSNNYGVVQRVARLTRYLERQVGDRTSAPRTDQPHKLSQRLSGGTVPTILAAYQAGATTREVGEQFGLAHSSINKLLKQHGITARSHSLTADEARQAVDLYEAGLSVRVIADHLGFGASTIMRALVRAGVNIRPRLVR
ncbi:helix-turn-helix protein [Blastococcus colisei]|uniref:Helix-turn-helix protein n=2 Tax=Blastococcus colisei TaxID=1564162 RepID=A0A543PCD3_9ACTN|nr:helix-turn-helix protein [Blastococcus colisei]